MKDSGIYQLVIKLPRNTFINVGNLGNIRFAEGSYIYTGSAKANLFKRLYRHFQKDKQFHWHIDYLLKYGEIIAYTTRPFGAGLECAANMAARKRYKNAEFISGFGSSDCKCRSHLIFIPPQ